MAEQDDGATFQSTIVYRDRMTALTWLENAFGFEVSFVVQDETDAIVHAEMKFGDGLLTVANEFAPHTRSPQSLGGMNTQQMNVRVDADIDAHCERARKAGAIITQEPADQFYGERTYRCLDFEGHGWVFRQPVHAYTIAEMEANTGNTLKIRSGL
jgi:uncharacterized glyoxalase superfamily protein PhnB